MNQGMRWCTLSTEPQHGGVWGIYCACHIAKPLFWTAQETTTTTTTIAEVLWGDGFNQTSCRVRFLKTTHPKHNHATR
jgi:hypothetical protein